VRFQKAEEDNAKKVNPHENDPTDAPAAMEKAMNEILQGNKRAGEEA